MPSLAVVCLGSTHRPLGLAALTTGAVDRAVVHLEAAVAVNRRLANRPLAAVVASELAGALLARDHPGDRARAVELLDAAAGEGRAASMLARAAAWAARADDLREGRGLLQMQGSQWRVGLAGCETLVPDRVGMRHLATLLANPGVEVRALALLGPAAPDAPGASGASAGDAVLDDAARAAYRARIGQLTAELDDADRAGACDRSARAQAELDALVEHLAAASGLGGRTRSFAGADDRGRTAVTKAVKRAIDVIGTTCPAIADHLRATVVTGGRCRYTGAVRWDVTADH
jgi:hypothetical protein